jgi:hypothetical protein
MAAQTSTIPPADQPSAAAGNIIIIIKHYY